MGWVCTVAGSPGTWVPFGGSWRTIAASAVAVARNSVNGAGDATETAAATIAIPANTLGANGIARIDATWSYTSSANVKSLRTRFGGTQYRFDGPTTTQSLRQITTFQNVNATNSQKGASSLQATSQGFDPVAALPVTSAIDTTASANVTLTTAWAGATSAETITLERYQVEVLYGA
jgi:hypothetical protein